MRTTATIVVIKVLKRVDLPTKKRTRVARRQSVVNRNTNRSNVAKTETSPGNYFYFTNCPYWHRKNAAFRRVGKPFSPVFSLLSSPPIWVFFENSVTGLSQHERGAVTKEVGSDKPFYRLLFPVHFSSVAI